MKINEQVLKQVQDSGSKILVVTKYLNKEETVETINYIGEKYGEIIEGFGENRVASLKEKDLPRELTHFIGNIQTKEIKYITKHCTTIHSVDNIKHIKKMEEICRKQNNWVQVFLQIKLDEIKPGGVSIDEIPKFLDVLGEMENVSLVGFSAIGKVECSDEEKRKEFQTLLDLRKKYIQNGFISAGTSNDYKIALEMGIDIVRLGHVLYK